MPYPHFSQQEFSASDIQNLSPALKVGILATVNPQGQPHLTLISTLMASSPKQVVWGQFTEGMSKQHILANPKTAFLVMNLQKVMWRGQASYTHSSKAGKDYEYYNNVPMFRYNAYFGVHTVHYMDLVGHSGSSPLPMNTIIFAAVQTMLARILAGNRSSQTVINGWTKAFYDKLDNLKFIGYVREDGFPVIIPAIQTQSLNAGQLVFSLGAFGEELAQIPAGASLAVFGMALSMEAVLVRGKFEGIKRRAGVRCGVVTVDWAYNCMPPAPAQIYPPLPLEAVQEF